MGLEFFCTFDLLQTPLHTYNKNGIYKGVFDISQILICIGIRKTLKKCNIKFYGMHLNYKICIKEIHRNSKNKYTSKNTKNRKIIYIHKSKYLKYRYFFLHILQS